ncbi:hypothetical protein FCV25MIE_24914 [Fagus crenata]
MRTGQSLNLATDEEAVNQWSSQNGTGVKRSGQYVFQVASDTWNELVEYEKIEETKLAVTVAVHDEVPAMEHHRDFKSAHIKSPANYLQSAKVNLISEPDLVTALVPFQLTPTHIDHTHYPTNCLAHLHILHKLLQSPNVKILFWPIQTKNPRK